MMAKWSEILVLSNTRLFGFTQPCFSMCRAKAANPRLVPSASSVFFTVAT